MTLENILLKIESNPKQIFEETTRLLIKIADNIIKEPSNLKIRTLQKHNATIAKHIIKITGGVDCLRAMGFQENETSLILPHDVPLNELKVVRDQLTKKRDEVINGESAGAENVLPSLLETASSEDDTDSEMEDEVQKSSQNSQSPIVPHNLPKVVLPPLVVMYTNEFLRKLEMTFHMALTYADKDLHKRALECIPLQKLEVAAQKRLRQLQEDIKKGKLEDPDISIQDMLLLELLSWFKNDFFQWVDSPDCTNCGGKSNFSHMSSDPSLLVHTTRVEMHVCSNCQNLTPFPRYNDVNILLLTRRGRCGEWANTFTLLCCALGWDARHVVDEGDHVWTEVYSFAQKRWLHCDPCENACDTPLIYESGWGKQISYVIAYSAEEVQDVTWRYTSHHKTVLQRRNKVKELELVDALIKLRENRQKNVTVPRRTYLINRLLCELVELMVEKKPNDTEQQGRVSGSLAWRLSRGETQDVSAQPYTWTIKEEHFPADSVSIRYCTASDKYEFVSPKNTVQYSLKGWQAGVLESSGVFRKEEKDWKMVYLARKEGENSGNIKWKFSVEGTSKLIDTVEVTFDHKLYENGCVDVLLCNDSTCLKFPPSQTHFTTSAFSGSKFFTINAQLEGGKGSVAWQHAQLFRQELSSSDYPFSVTITFK